MPASPPITVFEDFPEYEPYDSSKPFNIMFSNKLCPSVDSNNNSELVEEWLEEVGADLLPASSECYSSHPLPYPHTSLVDALAFQYEILMPDTMKPYSTRKIMNHH